MGAQAGLHICCTFVVCMQQNQNFLQWGQQCYVAILFILLVQQREMPVTYDSQKCIHLVPLEQWDKITIVGILTFISRINTTSERLEARNFFICRCFSFSEQFKFLAQLSWAWKNFYNLGAGPLDKSVINKKYFINQSKHMLWVLIRTVSVRQFLWAFEHPKQMFKQTDKKRFSILR